MQRPITQISNAIQRAENFLDRASAELTNAAGLAQKMDASTGKPDSKRKKRKGAKKRK